MDRRAALRTLLRGTCALAAVGAGCGGEWRDAVVLDAPASGAACSGGPTPGTAGEGWVEVRLEEHPGLREPDGFAEVRVPQSLLDVVVVHQDGRVLTGPATRPLTAFPAVRVGDSVFIHRPRCPPVREAPTSSGAWAVLRVNARARKSRRESG